MANDDLSIKVQFTQTFTIHPPSSINNKVEAEYWLNDAPIELRDVIGLGYGELEILEINE